MIMSTILLNSCKVISFFDPHWVSHTPNSNSSVIVAVGGPGGSLKEARLDALKQLSGIINTQVSTSISNYTAISYNEISREIEEKSSSWVESESDSIVIGIHEDERWFDKKTDSWWVLVSISKVDLKKSIQATAEELTRKKDKIRKNSLIAQDLIDSMLVNILDRPVSYQLHAISDALHTIHKLEFSEEIFFEVDLGYQHAISFLESLIKQMIASISLHSDKEYIVLYPHEVSRVSFSANSELGTLGSLSWAVREDPSDKQQIVVNDYYGNGYVDLIGDKDKSNKGFITVSLDISDLAIDLKVTSYPIIRIPTQKYIGRFGIVTQIDAPPNYRAYSEQSLLEVISANTEFNMENDPDIYPRMTATLHYKEGTKNSKLVAIHTSVTFLWEQKDGASTVYQTEYFKGFGGDNERAFEDAFKKNIAYIKKDKKFQKFFEECF